MGMGRGGEGWIWAWAVLEGWGEWCGCFYCSCLCCVRVCKMLKGRCVIGVEERTQQSWTLA